MGNVTTSRSKGFVIVAHTTIVNVTTARSKGFVIVTHTTIVNVTTARSKGFVVDVSESFETTSVAYSAECTSPTGWGSFAPG